MHISIWQQFGSNNSSNFTVVGEFDSNTEANQAALEILRLITEVMRWYEFPENAQARKAVLWPHQETLPLTPIELEYSQKYNVEWGEPIDWLVNSANASEMVEVVDRFVVMTNIPSYSWMSCHPISTLLERLGGKALCDDERKKEILAVVRCVAPDDPTAERLYTAIHEYFAAPHNRSVPWLDHGAATLGTYVTTTESLTELEVIYLTRERAESAFEDDNAVLMNEVLAAAYEAEHAGNHNHAAQLRQSWEDKKAEALCHLLQLSDTDKQRVLHARQIGFALGNVQFTGRQLRLSFQADPTDRNLPAVMSYLAANGCTDIQFSFEQG